MLKNHLLIFDIDGTITNTTEIDDLLISETLEHYGCDLGALNWDNFKHPTDEGILNQLISEHPELDLDKKLVKAHFLNLLEQASQDRPEEFSCVEGIEILLSKLLQVGYPLAIATGSWKRSGIIKLSNTEMPDPNIPFAHCDDHFARVRIAKMAEIRASAYYQKEWAKVTYFGDGLWDLDTAVKNGYQFVGVDYLDKGTFAGRTSFKTYSNWVDQSDSILTLLEDFKAV